MRKLLAAVLLTLGALTVVATPASADHENYTDGTETYDWGMTGDACTSRGLPSPCGLGRIPAWRVNVEECWVELDPPTEAWTTLEDHEQAVHYTQEYGTNPDGTATESGWVRFYLPDGQLHRWDASWNLGPGRVPLTGPEVLDCREPEPTTTTTTTVPDTTTTVPETTTTVPSTPTTTVPPDTTLPRTGTNATFPIVGAGLVVLGAIVLYIVRGEVKRDTTII